MSFSCNKDQEEEDEEEEMREEERERERILLTINKRLKVGKCNALSGDTASGHSRRSFWFAFQKSAPVLFR